MSVNLFMHVLCAHFLCILTYYEFLVLLGILPYFIKFACLLIVFTLSMPLGASGELSSIFVYRRSIYSPTSPNFTSYMGGAAFHGHVYWHIVSCNAVWLVIACNIPAAALLVLFNRGNIIPFFPPVTHCCLHMTHMYPWVYCMQSGYSIVLHFHCLDKNVL